MPSEVKQLVRELLPTAPELGLFVAPDIPAERLRGAVEDYAPTIDPSDVMALFDATFQGNGKDGAVFTSDRLIFQNHDWAPVQEIRYVDIVEVTTKKKFIGGRKVYVAANPGRATVTFVIDFSGKPRAADYVARFLQEVMMLADEQASDGVTDQSATDVDAVARALDELHARGKLSSSDLRAILSVINR